ncbi:P-loop NTPase fold protein [Catellatospora sichuanensis]|uniref:P-loop NTPase fold protein n=1 Tax=Catellatospora sichuanensis TaxID=1969805 RepID=UPI0011835D60|nr:P-loop NTPase fold protein [Catellatospora sichuanensis]
MSKQKSTAAESASPIGADDAPIQSLTGDRLGRRPFAQALAAEIMAAPTARGYVMGLTGAWGSGKTSILNMTVDAIGDTATAVHFNPWMFSGAEALVSSFFSEISKQLEKKEAKLKTVAGKLATYGQVLSPFAALTGAGGATQGALNILQALAAQPSVFEQHRELRELLAGVGKRLVVVIDDVDRLRPEEVLDIVRLVRLVGDFPNTLYLLAFDRARVEECLGEGDLNRGRAYLEKIVQVTHDVPAARQPDVVAMLTAGLTTMVDDLPTGPIKSEDWQNNLAFVIRPLLVTPRHVQRLLGCLSMTMRMVGDEIAFADLVAIDAIRVLHPTLFAALTSVADDLAAKPDRLGQGGHQPGRAIADSPIALLHTADPELAEPVCRWLFPAARCYFENTGYGPEWEGIWRRERKIASATVFRFYLERQLPEGVVPASVVDDALAVLADREGLRQLLNHWTPDELTDLIKRMNTAIEELPVAEDIEGDPARLATPILLDLLPKLPEDRSEIASCGSVLLMRTALLLLRRILDADVRECVICAVFSETNTLSARLILLLIVGHREDMGFGLIKPAVATELEGRLRNELAALAPGDFAGQDRIARLAGFMAETGAGRTVLHASAEDNRVMLSLLTDCVGETRGRVLGAAAVTVTKVLLWDRLAEWFGQEMLVRRIAEILTAVTDNGMEISGEQRAALHLAADYATGNRPQRPWERLVQQPPEADATLPNDDQATGARGGISSTSASHERGAALKDPV